MIEKNSTTRKPKQHGIINGRSSKKIINKRRRICKKIASSNAGLSKEKFLERYIKELLENGIPVPTRQTLLKDLKECNITFKNGYSQISNDDTIFNSLGYDINYTLRQIRLVCKNYDIFLVNTESKPILYPKTLEELLSLLKKLTGDNNHEENNTLQDADKPNVIANKSKKIFKKTIIHLYFILDKKGFEHLIEDTFCKDCNIAPDFLYIETHSYCTAIVFEYQHLKKIMNKVYEIIKYCPFEE